MGKYTITAILILSLLGCTKENNPVIDDNSGYCFAADFGSLGTKYYSSNNQYIDNATYQEYDFLKQKFGINPELFFYDDAASPNAYATSQVSNINNPDGQMAIGLQFIQNYYGNSGISIAIIMAHESAHIADNKYGTGLTGKYKELFADYMAGIYMHIKGIQQGSTYLDEATNTFYKLGDYEFNNPGHHGTPEQRKACLLQGYAFASNKANAGLGYGIREAMDNAIVFVKTIP